MLANGATKPYVNSTTATGFRRVHVRSACMLCARAARMRSLVLAHVPLCAVIARPLVVALRSVPRPLPAVRRAPL
eukprot:10422033-Alexandrium_andersonii.AAC.1